MKANIKKMTSIDKYTDVEKLFSYYEKPMTDEQREFFSCVNDFENMAFYAIEIGNKDIYVATVPDDFSGFVSDVIPLDDFYLESIEYYNETEAE